MQVSTVSLGQSAPPRCDLEAYLGGGLLVGQSATYEPIIFDTPFGRRAGDPALFLQPSDQQFRSDYVFLTPDTYFVDYVTVITAGQRDSTQ